MVYYFDSNGKKYKGKIHVCPKCGREKIIRENRNPTFCKKCTYGTRKTDVKDNETFIVQKSRSRTTRVRAIKSKCSVCGREYLRRACEEYKTSICNQCICNVNGKLSYTTGIGDYVIRAFEAYKRICFHCKSEENLEVHHIDFDRTNNQIENLQVLCKSCHKKIHWKERKKDPEFMKSFIANRSGENGPSKLTNEQVLEIRSLYPEKSQAELASLFNCGRTAIGHIIHRRSWKHI